MKWRHGWLRRKHQFFGWKRFQNHFKVFIQRFFTKANVKTRPCSIIRTKINKISYFPPSIKILKIEFRWFLFVFNMPERVLTYAFVKNPCINTSKWFLNHFQPKNRLYLRSHPCRHIPLIYANWPRATWITCPSENRPAPGKHVRLFSAKNRDFRPIR